MLRTPLAVALIVATMSACASAGGTPHEESPMQASNMRTVANGQSTTMAQGETVRLADGARLKFVSVPQDSRCPPRVQCIRAGDADIAFEYTPQGGAAMTVTSNLPVAPTKPIGASKLTVEQLDFGDAPTVTVRIDAP